MERDSTSSNRGREVDAVRAEAKRLISPEERDELEVAPETVAARGLATASVRREMRTMQPVGDSPDGGAGARQSRAARLPSLMISRGEISVH